MSFVDGGDLASIAADSTLANKDETETPQVEEVEKSDIPADEAPAVSLAQEDMTDTMTESSAPVSIEEDDDAPPTMVHDDGPVSMALHMPGAEEKAQELGEEVLTTTDLTQHTEEAGLEESASKELPSSTEVTDQVTHTVPSSDVSNEVTTTEAHFQSSDQQSTYANLQPIFLAMEMGQEGVHTPGEQHEEPSSTAAMIVQSQQILQVSQAGADGQGTNQLAFTQQVQGASMLLNSLASSTAEGTTPTSLQTILQDVVSGMQTNAGTVPAAIITDPSSSTGSYLIVNQNGIPIVRPVLVSNMPHDGSGTGHELQVLSAGTHGLEEGGAGDGHQETVTVEVGANTDAGSSGAGLVAVDVKQSMDLSSGEGLTVRVQTHHHDQDGSDEESTPSRVVVGGKRKLSDGPRICEQCNKAFKYPSDLKKHLQIHTNVKKFKCEDCGRLFRRLHQLNVHTRIHTGEKPYVCNRCGISFRHDSTLTMHIRTRHDHLRPFKCEDCGNTFGRLSHLRKHVRKVCGNRRNKDRPIAQCRFCDENFPTKGDLRKHVLTCEKKEEKVKAKEVTLHVCDQCSKDFASPYNLRRHLLTHTDEKPYTCEVCARTFKEKSSLSKHIKRKHTGVDQGSQTDETGETEYNNVDVIAESATVSGVAMDTEDSVEGLDDGEETSTVDASSLIPTEGVHLPNHEVRVQGTQVIQGDIEMTTIELSLPPGSESHEATALQAAVEALVSASQQQIAVDQESMEVSTEEASTGKEIFEGVESQGVVTTEVTELTDPGLGASEEAPGEFVEPAGEPAAQEQVSTQ